MDNDIKEEKTEKTSGNLNFEYNSSMLNYKRFVSICNIIFILILFLPLINGLNYFMRVLGSSLHFYLAAIFSIIINILWYFKLRKEEKSNFGYLLFIPTIMHGYAVKKSFNVIIGTDYYLSMEIKTLDQFMYNYTLDFIDITIANIIKDIIFIFLILAIILSYMLLTIKNNKVKKTISIFFVLFIVFSAIIFWSQYKTLNQELTIIGSNNVEYEADNDKIVNMKCPVGWDEVDYSSQGVELVLANSQDNESRYFDENINLIIEDLSENMMDLETYINLSIGTLKNYFKDFKLIEATEGSLGNYNAKKNVYSGKNIIDEIEYTLQFMQVCTIVGNEAYVVTYTSQPSRYYKYLDAVEECINSFKIK